MSYPHPNPDGSVSLSLFAEDVGWVAITAADPHKLIEAVNVWSEENPASAILDWRFADGRNSAGGECSMIFMIQTAV